MERGFLLLVNLVIIFFIIKGFISQDISEVI